jgi:hypothetical protein
LIKLIDRNGFLQSEIRIPQSAIERLGARWWMLDAGLLNLEEA